MLSIQLPVHASQEQNGSLWAEMYTEAWDT